MNGAEPAWRHAREDMLAVSCALVGGAAVATVSVSAPVGLRVMLFVLVWVAIEDVRSFRIPNAACVVAAVTAAGCWAAAGAHAAPLLAGFGVAGVLVVAYLAGGVGAGDVKMLPSVALAVTACAQEGAIAILLACVLLTVTFLYAFVLHLVTAMSIRGSVPVGPAMLLAGVTMLPLAT